MTKRVALLFPGQGSQYGGMGKDFTKDQKKWFSSADDILGFSLSDLCFNNSPEILSATYHAQPAILTHSIASMEKIQPLLEKKKITVERVMGHSLGEWSALVAAGVLSFQEAVLAVYKRGRYMQEACPLGEGKMIACLRVSPQKVEEACHKISSNNNVVGPANFNGPDQTVISGMAKAIDQVKDWLSKNGEERFRSIELKVSVPAHCPLMKPAAEKLSNHLDTLNWHKNRYPYMANKDSFLYPEKTSEETVKNNLIEQMTHPVLWWQSMKQLPDDLLCLEVGPGKVLTGLAKKINPLRQIIPLDSKDALEQIDDAL